MKSKINKKNDVKNEVALFNNEKNELLSKINFDNDTISLTDLWKLAGSPKNKRPVDWQKVDSTQQLIETVGVICQSGCRPLWSTRRGGLNPGTYAHKSIALAYAKYLDAKLHILVNDVFFQRIEEEKNPDLLADRMISSYKKKGKSDKWISQRVDSKIKRNAFTGCLKEHGVNGDGYRNCTNAVYNNLFGGTSNVVREKKGLQKSQSIRDNMTSVELAAVSLSEALAMENIENNNRHGNAQCEIACTVASKSVAKAVIDSKRNYQVINI